MSGEDSSVRETSATTMSQKHDDEKEFEERVDEIIERERDVLDRLDD